MNIKEEIIEFIETNRISTTEVADVLGKQGQIGTLHPLIPGLHKTGEVKLIYAINNSNYEVHRQLAEQDDIKNKILYIHNINCTRAIFGDLVCKYILLYKQAKAIVVNGLLRDAHTLLKEKYPVWLQGVSPIGCVNTPNGPDIDTATLQQLKAQYDGAIMVCDDSGVVMIPKNKIDLTLKSKLNFIELQEDIWYYCIDTLKMSTFDTVCLRKYLTTPGLVPHTLLDKLNSLQKEENISAKSNHKLTNETE